jgi:hypothetical protein
MPDILVQSPAKTYKVRCRLIVADNAGLDISQKSVSFFVGIYASNEDGTQISGSPKVEKQISFPVLELLSDPETAQVAGASLQALEGIGALICQRFAQQLLQELTEV